MKIDPAKRSGKGSFPKDVNAITDDPKLLEDVLKKAQTRVVLFDYLYMVFVGFTSALKGLFQFSGKTSNFKDRDPEK